MRPAASGYSPAGKSALQITSPPAGGLWLVRMRAMPPAQAGSGTSATQAPPRTSTPCSPNPKPRFRKPRSSAASSAGSAGNTFRLKRPCRSSGAHGSLW